jgi:phage terminase small subunit
MRGAKPTLRVVHGPQPSGIRAPRWLPAEAKAEWAVAVADLAGRGLLFRGALASLAAYCVCTAHVRQRQAILDADPGDRVAFAEQMKAAAMAKQLAVELGLTVVSRSRSFTAQPAGKGDDWGDVVNG